MMLVLSPVTGITMSSCKPPFYIDYSKMASPLAHSSVNGPSEKLTGLDNGLCLNDYTLEKENIDAILHTDQPCNATELCSSLAT
jgi:hypothetical protein